MNRAHTTTPSAAGTVKAEAPLDPAVGRSARVVGQAGAARWALLWVMPYLILGVVWVFTNPPGAAPDESDHLVKAIAAGRFDIGVPFAGSYGTDLGSVRNNSIARTVLIPANVAPDGYKCTAFQPDVTARCLPAPPATGDELVEWTASVGAYPIFAYVPIGLATRFADTPTGAFHLARLVSLLMSIGLLFLAVWHLTRWLGRGAAVGLAVGLTPMAIFAASAVSTSGVEIMSAAVVAAVVVVVTRSPATLAAPETLLVLGISGSALALSRQLGVVTLGLLGLIALVRGGGRVLWEQVRQRRWPVIAMLVVLGLSVVAVAVWELHYDHPVLTGPVLSAGAFGSFVDESISYLRQGVGVFGWLDTPLPGPAIGLWVFVAITIIGGALLVGRRADRLTIVASLIVILVVAYITYATVFYPIEVGLQGRHLLPIFMIVPMLAGVALAEHLQLTGHAAAARRLAAVVGVTMAVLQLLSLLVNGRRYAVGLDGPIWFVPFAEWSPRFGWWPWFIVATAAVIWLAMMIIRGGRSPVALTTREPENVGR